MPTVSVNGVTLAYELEGPDGAPVIAFSNSLGSAMAIWDGVVPALHGSFRTLRYDTRGHGRSGPFDTAISVDDLAADLIALLDHLSIATAHVTGLSLGGVIAQAVAVRYPERVDKLILIATAAQFPPPEFWLNRANNVRASGAAAVVDTIVPRWFTDAFRAAHPDVVEAVRQAFLGVDKAGYARCCEALASADLREAIKGIKVPTLVIGGGGDVVATPAMGEALRAAIPGAELVVLPGVAHLMSVERPEAVETKIAAFLGGAGGSKGAFEKGLAVRKAVLGSDYVEAALAKAGSYGASYQDYITRAAWNDIWGDPTLPRNVRSMLTLAMMIALHREEEFKLHVRPALKNGVTPEELRAVILQTAVYAGVPAANAGMRWVREVLGDELK